MDGLFYSIDVYTLYEKGVHWSKEFIQYDVDGWMK